MSEDSDAVEEGLAIAHAAARLAVKNTILVSTIALDETFDPQAFVADARSALGDIASESEIAAQKLKKLRRRAWGRYGESRGTHDYRDRDTRNLRKRAKQSEGVARAIRAEMDDDSQVLALVEQAREAAWHDIEATLQSRLRVEGMRADSDPNYAAMREARMQALRLVDLQKLAAETRPR